MTRLLRLLMVIPHNPIRVGSPKSIIHHPAFYRKLSIFATFFDYIVVFRGSLGNSVIRKLKLIHNGKDYTIIDIPIIYHGILLYTLLFIVHFTCLIFRLKSLKNVKLYLLCFNHAHLYSMYAKILSAILKLKIISFYVTTPINFKERILYFVSKIMDTLSITNHPLIAFKLKLRKPIIIPNVPDKMFFCNVSPESRNKKTLLLIARLTREKGTDIAIAIIAELSKHFPDVKLLIVGDGPLRRHFEKLALKYQLLGKNVFFLGYKPLNDVLSLMKKAGALLYTSIREYFPNVLIEAMACNLPVLVFSTDAYRWIIGRPLLTSTKISKITKIIANLLMNDSFYNEQVHIQKEHLQKLLNIYRIQSEVLKELILKS